MAFHAGRPMRLELCGLALAGTVAVLLINDKIDRKAEIQRANVAFAEEQWRIRESDLILRIIQLEHKIEGMESKTVNTNMNIIHPMSNQKTMQDSIEAVLRKQGNID